MPTIICSGYIGLLEKELKRIEKAGGWVSDGRILGNLNLSRGLGDSEYKVDPKLK